MLASGIIFNTLDVSYRDRFHDTSCIKFSDVEVSSLTVFTCFLSPLRRVSLLRPFLTKGYDSLTVNMEVTTLSGCNHSLSNKLF